MSVNFNPPPSGGPPKNIYQSHGTFTTADAGFDPATFDQRLIAWTIDVMILAALQKGVDVALGGVGSTFFNLLMIAYFVVGHYYFECTAGKYFVGLRVHVLEDDSKKLLKIIFRETIGRLLSGLFLCFGYLAIFFSRDRASWHDRISGTQVISLSPVTSSGLAIFFRSLGAFVLLIVGFTGYIAYSILYSSAPLEALEARLALQGVHITGIRGNMMNGYEIDKLTYERDKNYLELNSIRLHIDPWANMQGAKQFKLKHLIVESGIVRVAPLTGKKSETAVEKKDEKKRSQGKSGNVAILIEQVDINSIVFEGFDQKFDLSRFFISNIKFSTEPVSFSMDRFYVDSSNFSVDVPKLEYFAETFTMPKPLFGKVKMAGFPEKLKMDLNFSARYWTDDKKDKFFDVQLFNSQVKLARQGSKYSLNTNQWSPSNYFKGHYPISQINLNVQGEDVAKAEIEGGYFLRQTRVAVPKQKGMMALMALMGQEAAPPMPTMKPAVVMLAPIAFKQGGPPWMKIVDGVTKTEADSLSWLYFKKTADKLSDHEKAAVDADLAFFATSVLPSRFKEKLSEGK